MVMKTSPIWGDPAKVQKKGWISPQYMDKNYKIMDIFMAAIVVRIRTIGLIRTICPKWSNFWSEFDFWSEFSIDDTHA